MTVSRGFFIIFLAGLALCAGCQSARYSDRAPSVVAIPDTFSIEGMAGAAPNWEGALGSAKLQGLIARAFQSNLTLRAAMARVRQAEAVAQQARGGLWPSVDLQSGASRSKMSSSAGNFSGAFAGGGAGGAAPGGFASDGQDAMTTYQFSLAAAYELDVWGRLSKLETAAQLEAEATEMDARALTLTLAAQVAESWLQLISQGERAELIHQQIEVSEQYLELTKWRLRQGQATALDVNQQKQQLESLRGLLALTKGA